MFAFEIVHESVSSAARVGKFSTPHGVVDTPAFMPVGTCGTIKGVTRDHIVASGSQMILANTYHLLLRPGPEVVAALGGVHNLMAWDGPILTDSGGYQVFSLAKLRKVDEDGVTFASHIDGATVVLTPERAVRVQELLGADVIMQLDECPPHDAARDVIAGAVRRSAAWARRCAAAKSRDDQALFAIQQGGLHADLRAASAEAIVQLDLPGYAVGGLSVGEGHEAMIAVLDAVDGQFPRSKPRYLMGVGEPADILAAVTRGIDLFDCVLPTRNGRNAFAYTFSGPLRMRNACHTGDRSPLEESCPCLTCRHYSRGALRHLFLAGEMLGPILLSIHNITFFARFMAAIRAAIAAGQFASKARQWLGQMNPCRAGRQST
ncbi:MAG: tRNA guanosine(34) transglycosylase Tgt [Planctomycetes bacterium]|nr:tRNA guanosine(34) transglycosylase Tgt [Planctomycetota bacterium]